MRKNQIQRLKYLLADALGSGLVWTFFFYYRKAFIESEKFGTALNVNFNDFFYYTLGSVIAFWLLLYASTGFYKNVWRKSRLLELAQTSWVNLLGVIVIFFALILDDEIVSYKTYYESFGVLYLSQTLVTALFRFSISTQTVRRIRKGSLGFNTLLVGNNEKATELIEEMRTNKRKTGERFVGYVDVLDGTENLIGTDLPHLGHYEEVKNVIEKHEVEDVIIAIESSEHGKLQEILTKINGAQVTVKVIPDMYDILSGMVRMSTIFGTPLIEVSHKLMPTWQWVIKRMIDLGSSIFALLVLLPVYVFTAIMVKLSSPGPIFFLQERIGLGGKPFHIIKFRSMVVDAEKHGPALSSDDDPRITTWGKIMRKYRLDELPQFFNVLKGDMSLVGPRPERAYYIEKIVEQAPHYKRLLKVRPGITSWGMVKYGYAQTIDEMVKRLKFDLLYIENMSLLTDFKILIYTVLIVLQGRGK